MKKRILTTLLAVLMTCGICFAFSGCFLFDSTSRELTFDEKWEINTISATSEKRSSLGYTTTVKGTLRNKLNETYSYVQIKYSMYDADGNNLGIAYDSMNNLGAGESWSFSATSMGWTDVQVVRVRFAEVSTF